jgi:orotate phosphoribosyltransferase-like protein
MGYFKDRIMDNIDEVLELYAEGFNKYDICEILELYVDEVKFILENYQIINGEVREVE